MSVSSIPSTPVPIAVKLSSFTVYLISSPFAKDIHVDIVHTIRGQSYDRPVASSKASSPDDPLSLQYPLFSLKSYSSCLRLVPRLTVTSILPPTFPSVTCLRRQILREVFPFFLFYAGYSFPRRLYAILFFIFHRIHPTDLLQPSLAPRVKNSRY